ncbi:Nuclear transport factor 2 [Monoraphidium neglectum]|uniref:Nuclear transport factor 2 n=1 Tax=Monoraphidium neglectum TaxID=145388 RepID=A0A0D2LN64_9CHLO|nr:Nuclear transport factor 2 [Monoraphidium neglectum]KIZ07699.1 Nuclear transport factor 2 [Monoraphidium neglectum]|eukprot:XP_013906718.1 Nuclear transport factor 2 [Monoraphidium neglectum]
MSADPEQVGKAFLEYYYGLFGSNRAALASLYQDQSLFTFEGAKCQGPAAIVAKLTSLPFNQAKVATISTDFQPSISGGIIVFVTGQVQTEGESNALKFSQVFHLMPVGSSFVVTNDMFRLNYG